MSVRSYATIAIDCIGNYKNAFCCIVIHSRVKDIVLHWDVMRIPTEKSQVVLQLLSIYIINKKKEIRNSFAVNDR